MDKALTSDPRELQAMEGIEAMRAMIAMASFAQPSISDTLGFKLVEVEPGRVVFEGEPSERILNPLGVVHGGWALTLIDSCLRLRRVTRRCPRASATARSKPK